jgi:hypothetical protein
MKKLLLAALLLTSASAFADDKASLWVFGGRVDDNGNTNSDYRSSAYQIEQETPTAHGTWDLGYLNEGSLNGRKRDGLYGLLKVPFQFTPRVETSIAFGPYLNATTVNDPNGTSYKYKYGATFMTALSLKYKLTEKFAVQARYGHALMSSDGHDADHFMFGVGYSM